LYFIRDKKASGIGVANITIIDAEDCLLFLQNGKSQFVKFFLSKEIENKLLN